MTGCVRSAVTGPDTL